jgi:hypothetical protein
MRKVTSGEATLKTAAGELGVSYRQALRRWRRYREEGDAGLTHRLRGRASNHGGRSGERIRALTLVREHYADFGPTLAAEQLARRDGIVVNHETLRCWMKAEGLWERRRKRKGYRQWRERKGRWGEMVQMDGSEHDWFEGRGPRCVMMVMIDDATNRTHARFFPGETTAAAWTIFGEWVRAHGVPESLYVDRDSIYETTREATTEEALRGARPLTQFGRTMERLGVRVICAHSPQAKGRVERRHGVMQDRLVKEMRLEKIGDMAAANAYLRKRFLPDMNRRYTVAAQEAADAHRRLPLGVKLAEVLSWEEERTVQNDWTVRWRNRWLQVTEGERKLGLAGQRIVVRERLNGTVELVYRGRRLAYRELPDRPPREGRGTAVKTGLPERRGGPWKPPADHPWRTFRRGKNQGR